MVTNSNGLLTFTRFSRLAKISENEIKYKIYYYNKFLDLKYKKSSINEEKVTSIEHYCQKGFPTPGIEPGPAG